MQREDARVPCGAREHNKMRKEAHDSSAIMPKDDLLSDVLSIPFDKSFIYKSLEGIQYTVRNIDLKDNARNGEMCVICTDANIFKEFSHCCGPHLCSVCSRSTN